MFFQNSKYCFLYFPLLKSHGYRTKTKQAASLLITRIFKAAFLPWCCVSGTGKTFLLMKMWASWASLLCLDRYTTGSSTLARIHGVQNRERKCSTEASERISSVMAKSLIFTCIQLLPCCLEKGNKQCTGYALNCVPMSLFHQQPPLLKVFLAPEDSLLSSFSDPKNGSLHTMHLALDLRSLWVKSFF